MLRKYGTGQVTGIDWMPEAEAIQATAGSVDWTPENEQDLQTESEG